MEYIRTFLQSRAPSNISDMDGAICNMLNVNDERRTVMCALESAVSVGETQIGMGVTRVSAYACARLQPEESLQRHDVHSQ